MTINNNSYSFIEQPISKKNKEETSLLWEMAHLAGKSIAISTADHILNIGLSHFADYGFCFGNIVSKKIQTNFLRPLRNLLTKPNLLILRATGLSTESFLGHNVITPMVEEMEFRYFFQNIILKKLPELTFQRFAPSMVSKVNCLPVKVSRIFCSALLFTLLHLERLDCSAGGGISIFTGGVFYGMLLEQNVDIVNLILLHSFYNVLSEQIQNFIF